MPEAHGRHGNAEIHMHAKFQAAPHSPGTGSSSPAEGNCAVAGPVSHLGYSPHSEPQVLGAQSQQ